MFPRCQVEDPMRLCADSYWVGDVSPRNSYSGGYIQRNGGTVCQWSKTHSNASFSARGKMNSTVKGVSAVICVTNSLRELFAEDRRSILGVDASACKRMLLRTGVGKGEHLRIKQIRAQGAIRALRREGAKSARRRKRRWSIRDLVTVLGKPVRWWVGWVGRGRRGVACWGLRYRSGECEPCPCSGISVQRRMRT